MSPQYKIITKNIRADILQRSACAITSREIGRAIYDALTAGGLDWRKVPRGEVKSVLVEAMRAFRADSPCGCDPLAV